ncbi:hypothetical protein M3J07_004576 [Ascochyta lentis]
MKRSASSHLITHQVYSTTIQKTRDKSSIVIRTMGLRAVRHVSQQLWEQLPLGTELRWAFVTHRLNRNRNAILNSTKLFGSAFLHLLNVWTVIAIPRATHLYQENRFPPAPPQLVAKAAYYFIIFPLAYLSVAVSILILATVSVAAVLLLVAVIVAVVGSWAVAVLLLFILWLGLYRLPIYEIIYPRLRNWISSHNSAVYSPLTRETPTIRVVQLRPGGTYDRIECDLVSEPLAEASFEALSYVWGTVLLPCKIYVNDRPFYITQNLRSALQELRHERACRMLWIDAICINQSDNYEKSAQVRMMRDIYASAVKVVVWLGKGEKFTGSALELVRQFDTVSHDAESNWWKDLVASSRWRKLRGAFRSMMGSEWWTRTWIIQEVVLGKDIVVHLGPHQISWDLISRFISCRPFMNQFESFETPRFAKDVQELRLGMRGDEAISNTLLGLTYRFRWQAASFGSDKIYALLGLLKPDNPTLLVPEYDKSPVDVFLEFTLSCIKYNGNLTAIALAAGTDVQDISWCRDWRLRHDGHFSVAHFCTYPPPDGPDYSAAGTHAPVFQVSMNRLVLSLRGYEVDVVARTGEFYQDIINLRPDWLSALLSWEHIAGGPWKGENEFERSFNRTITGDGWSIEPLNWKSRIRHRGKPSRNQEDQSYLNLIDQVCQNRRFFLTKSGRFGLGPWNTKKSDTICVLLGGKTPFVLRPCAQPDGSITAENHKVLGEAFVDGLMYYKGSVEDDIREGKVAPRWYHLR